MMTTALVQEQKLEKQMEKQIGCMSGLLRIFDRQQIFHGKRVHSKRLPASAGGGESSPETVKPAASPAVSREFEKREPMQPLAVNDFSVPKPPKSPLPFPMFQPEDGTPKSSWKFCKDMPRLSLDSRATFDSKGSLCPREIRVDRTKSMAAGDGDDKQPRSPSVVARLMGLETLPSSDSSSTPESVKKPDLRRSASESRVSRDLFHSRFIDGNNFPMKQPNQASKKSMEINMPNSNGVRNDGAMELMEHSSRNIMKSDSPRTSPWKLTRQRTNFFNSTDFFPEPKQTTASMNRDFEKKLKIRGIDEQLEDLEALKHVLESMQLKGLLHSKRPSDGDHHRNFFHDRNFASDESKVVIMKPWRSPASNVDHRSFGSGRIPARGRNSIVKGKPLSVETVRCVHESSESRRNSPTNSPRFNSKRNGSDPQSITNRSPRNQKPVELIKIKDKRFKNSHTEDESSSISESAVSSSSQTDTERSKTEDYREGKSLLERCDKLLNCIAEMNSNTESQPSSASVLPSPVSVLDSVFDKDDSSPSPIMKRSIDFKDPVDLEDEISSRSISPVKSTEHNEFRSDDSDFMYISEVLQALQYLPEDSDVFLLLEKQRYRNGKDTSKASRLQRKLVFDVLVEILDRNRRLEPWKAVRLMDSDASLEQIWSEFQKIRERNTTDELLELICGILKKDLAGINGWEDRPVEMSEAVLDIERMIFKDLVSETIGDLAELAGKSTFSAIRRKLVF